MAKGKVKWYDEVKGFGFIMQENGDDLFVHKTSLEKQFEGLEENQEVEFDIEQGQKGLVAVNVKTLN